MKTDKENERKTILIVEDSADLRFLISDTLRNEGYRVVEAATTEEAFSFLKLDLNVSLVFVDIVLPGEVDGLALAEHLQRERPDIKVILTTGKVEREAVPSSFRVIRKPYILAKVVSEINALLKPQEELNHPSS